TSTHTHHPPPLHDALPIWRGRATSFQNAAHTPLDKKQEDEWGHYTHTKGYEGLHDWDLPMMAKLHTEAQCAKCHQGVVEVPKARSEEHTSELQSPDHLVCR